MTESSGGEAGNLEYYNSLGISYLREGNLWAAIGQFENGLKIAKQIKNKEKEAEYYINLGVIHGYLGDFKKEIEYSKKAIKILKEIDDKFGEAICYGHLGTAYRNLGFFKSAIEDTEKALKIFTEGGDRAGVAECFTNLGNAYAQLGDLMKAKSYLVKALEIAKDIDDTLGKTACHANLGNYYLRIGEFQKAAGYLEKALTLARNTNNLMGEATCYTMLCNVYYSLGDFTKVFDHNEKALEIYRKIGNRSGEFKCLITTASVLAHLEHFEEEINYHQEALEIARELGNIVGVAICMSNLGIAHYNLENFDNAIDYTKKALETAQEIGDISLEATCYNNLGDISRDLEKFADAIEYKKKALAIGEKIDNIDLARRVHYDLALIYGEDLNKIKIAYNHCDSAIKLLEKMTASMLEEELKIKFFSRIPEVYQYMVSLCLTLNKCEESFAYVERSKSRAFLELLAATEIKPSVELAQGLRDLLDEEKIYIAKMRGIQTRHLKENRIPREVEGIDQISRNLENIYNQIEKFDPEYVFTRRGRPLSLDQIRNLLSSQKRHNILIEYFISKDRLYIFVLSSRDSRLHIEPIKISREKLNTYILGDFKNSVLHYSGPGDSGENWSGLKSYLIDPIARYIKEDDLIYFVPYGTIHYLPLHALELNGEPLIKRHPVVYSPSSSLIQFCQKKGSGKLKNTSVFGVEFEEEASDVAKILDVPAYLSKDASKEKFIKTCSAKDIIHLSCHGKFNKKEPLSSGIKLCDGIFTAREIFDIKLNAGLVTLSACETGISEIAPGDELIGLTRAFIYAGASSVVVSLWIVGAQSTKELMVEFYKLLKGGADKATALQQAQIKIMAKEEYKHPYFWAPFILVGDWA